MGSKKDIGKAYKERLEGYASPPHNRVWENIEAELKKSKRRGFPIWKTLTGLGILLLLIGSFGVYTIYFNSDNDHKNSIDSPIENLDEVNHSSDFNEDSKDQNSNDTTVVNNESDTDSQDNNTSNTINATGIQTNTDSSTQQNSTHTTTRNMSNSGTGSAQANFRSKNNDSFDKTLNALKNGSDANATNQNADANDRPSYLESIVNTMQSDNDSISVKTYPVVYFDIDGFTKLEGEKKKKKKKKKKTTPKENPLVISAYVLPTYFNAFGSGSSIDSKLDNNKKIGGINLNFGVAATIKISKRSSLRLGLAQSTLSYTIKDADTTDANGFLANAPDYDNLTINSQATNMSPETFGSNTIVDYKQTFNYIEIPLDYIYHLRDDTNIKIDITGGLSALSLSDQSIFAIDASGQRLEIGKSENLRKTNFSLNLGGQFSYDLSEKLKLNVEPRFKYYLSTFSNDVNVQPMSFGIRFGITYKF